MIFKRSLIICILFLSSAVSALSWVGVSEERTDVPLAKEEGRSIYAVYGRVNSDDYLPEQEATTSQSTAKARRASRAGVSLINDLPASFLMLMVPVFLGLLIMVLYLFINDIDREDKVVLARDLGSMDS